MAGKRAFAIAKDPPEFVGLGRQAARATRNGRASACEGVQSRQHRPAGTPATRLDHRPARIVPSDLTSNRGAPICTTGDVHQQCRHRPAADRGVTGRILQPEERRMSFRQHGEGKAGGRWRCLRMLRAADIGPGCRNPGCGRIRLRVDRRRAWPTFAGNRVSR